jgi:putative YhdH/YhfP family quinone oxidoreductase
MDSFKAFRIHTSETGATGRFEQLTLDDIDPGDVVIRTAYSAANYKDAMAAHGIGKNIRADPPCVGGVDMSGVVLESADPHYRPGDPVIVTNFALGASHDGGYSEIVRVPADWIVPLPDGMTLREAMGLGSAGLTAALAMERLEAAGLTPDAGPVAVSGATGAVGSLAVDILAKRGYRVTGITGKDDQHDYLRHIGAADVLSRRTLEFDKRMLATTRWAGAVDTVGMEMLDWLTKTTQFHGRIAVCGGAAGFGLETNVLPFILRAIDYLGVNITRSLSREKRLALWQSLTGEMRPNHLDEIIRVVPFGALPQAFDDLVAAKVTGRIVVEIGGETPIP